MSTDMKKCHVASSGNIISPKGRLSYAQFLVESQTRKYEDSGKTVQVYNLSLLLPPDSDLTELKKKMAKIALEKCDGDKKRALNFVEKRFLDPNNLPQGGKPAGEEFEGWTLIRASSSYKPRFVYPNRKAVPDEEVVNELYSGRWARVTLNPYWTSNKTNPGVMLGLQNVQLLDHDENLGVAIPNAEDEFDAVEGAEEAEAGASVADNDVDAMFG